MLSSKILARQRINCGFLNTLTLLLLRFQRRECTGRRICRWSHPAFSVRLQRQRPVRHFLCQRVECKFLLIFTLRVLDLQRAICRQGAADLIRFFCAASTAAASSPFFFVSTLTAAGSTLSFCPLCAFSAAICADSSRVVSSVFSAALTARWFRILFPQSVNRTFSLVMLTRFSF